MKRSPGLRVVSLCLGPIGRIARTLVALALAACAAAPPLKIYAFSEDPEVPVTTDAPPPHGAPLIEVANVTLPAYLDSRDLVVRQGDVLERSSTGRWASRLSLGATELLTARLTTRWPEKWVTDQPQARTADYRLMVHISRLDITTTGTGVVEADWEIVPHGASAEIIRRRIRFTMNGSVATDQDIARFERALLDRLAGEIDVSELALSARPAANEAGGIAGCSDQPIAR